jgi:hypothetical protein
MARTYRRETYHESDTWRNKPGKGRWMKRQLHKAERRAFKGTGPERSVNYWGSMVNRKGT